MDVGAFVQENKRWLIGCAIGGLVYLVANIVVDSLYSRSGEESTAAGVLKSLRSSEVYGADAAAAASEEAEVLAKERSRLQAELEFRRGPAYALEGKGAPDEFLFQTGRTLKQRILNAANERNVDVADKEVGWPAVSGVDEIRGVLFGLELLDEASARLFAAHDAVRAKDPEAMGLRGILQMKTEDRRSQRTPMRSSRSGEVVLGDYLIQERVLFQVQADAPTLAAFFESFRAPGRTLTLETVQIQPGPKPGDPVTAKGTLQGIAFKEKN